MGKLLFTLSLLFSATMLYAQMCGGGVYTIQFTGPESKALKNIPYKVFTISQAAAKSLMTKFSNIAAEHEPWQYYYSGVLIDGRTLNMRQYVGVNPNVVTWDTFRDTTWIKRSTGVVLDSLSEKRLQRFYAGLAESLQHTAHFHGLDEVKFQDSVRNGLIRFPTSETYTRFFLLQFTWNHTAWYLLGALFGSCSRNTELRLLKTGGFRKLKTTSP